METSKVSQKKRRKSNAKSLKGSTRNRFSFEIKLKAVRANIDGIPISSLSEKIGCSPKSISTWKEKYLKDGEEGLKESKRSIGSKTPEEVKEKIIEIKQETPDKGSKSISQILKRFFFIQSSSSTVNKVLKDEGLVAPPKKKRKKNPEKPRFFERTTPNQLWQTDIFCFRLNERNAYLIGYIDDYSRYIVGLGLYRSQTAENVIELYRRAAGEYNKPKEMLTDNGRQYTNWRGQTRFEKELVKDRVKHIKSQPHHPMTLGKIERFWKTIFEEFLAKAQFGSFEEAEQRLAVWVKYYNHQRPHQGIGGLCPADRYFEIAHDLKKTIEQGIQENALEIALRGKPKDPFYMVGRMNGESVVIQAEKGKVRMQIAGEENQHREIEYDITNEKETDNGKATDQNQTEEESDERPYRCEDSLHSSTEPVDGVETPSSHLQGTEHSISNIEYLGEKSNGGDASGLGASDSDEQWSSTESSLTETISGEEAGESRNPSREDYTEIRESFRAEEQTTDSREEGVAFEKARSPEGSSTTSRTGYPSPQRSGHSDRSSEGVGDLEKKLLPMGEESSGGNAIILGRRGSRPPKEESESRADREGERDKESGERISSCEDSTENQRLIPRSTEYQSEKKRLNIFRRL